MVQEDSEKISTVNKKRGKVSIYRKTLTPALGNLDTKSIALIMKFQFFKIQAFGKEDDDDDDKLCFSFLFKPAILATAQRMLFNTTIPTTP